MVITSRQNAFVKEILSLKDKKGRRESGRFIVEGIKQVREAVASGAAVEHIVCTDSYDCPDEISAVPRVLVSGGVFEKLSEEMTPQGILAVLRIPVCSSVPPQGNCLLLDGIADPGNLGTIIRTANAAGYGDVYLKNCADPFSSKCVRASMSGLFFVRLHIGGEEVLDALAGLPLICADMRGENVFDFAPPPQFCLVIGNEANGVSEHVRTLCLHAIKIPMRSSCESLNAGVSAGILMYELAQRQKKN